VSRAPAPNPALLPRRPDWDAQRRVGASRAAPSAPLEELTIGDTRIAQLADLFTSSGRFQLSRINRASWPAALQIRVFLPGRGVRTVLVPQDAFPALRAALEEVEGR
jgi:hypothetical protein